MALHFWASEEFIEIAEQFILVLMLDLTFLLQRLQKKLDCIFQNVKQHNDGRAGLEVVKILEACDRSLSLKGQLIALEPAFA